jgi:hypothetical protein
LRTSVSPALRGSFKFLIVTSQQIIK